MVAIMATKERVLAYPSIYTSSCKGRRHGIEFREWWSQVAYDTHKPCPDRRSRFVLIPDFRWSLGDLLSQWISADPLGSSENLESWELSSADPMGLVPNRLRDRRQSKQ